MAVKQSYTDFIELVTIKELSGQYKYYLSGINQDIPSYYLFAYDGPQLYEEDIQDADSVSDFELKYKNNWNKIIQKRNDYGATIVSPTLDDIQGLYPKKKMYKNHVIAGMINIFDEEIVVEKRICGGEYWIKQEDTYKIHDDDYVEFAIVDKNDVLGLFSAYGLSKANGDILELTKFVLTDYIKKGNSINGYHSLLYEGIKGTNLVYPGLFMRCIINSNGTENFTEMWRCYYYE